MFMSLNKVLLAMPKYADRRAAVSVIFATALIPLLLIVGLAIDYGFFVQAQEQLDTAADMAALHAARIASELLQENDNSADATSKAKAAGEAWFAAQQGGAPAQAISINPPEVSVTYSAGLVTAKVNYNGLINVVFGGLINIPQWNIAGNATAEISNPAYVEIDMLLDNSSSMLIAADPANIEKMEELTPCSEEAQYEGQPIDIDYSWAYTQIGGVWQWGPNVNPPPINSAQSTTKAPNNPAYFLPYGYGIFVYPLPNSTTLTYSNDVLPPLTPQVGQCDYRFTDAITDPTKGNAAECSYPGSFLPHKLLPAGTTINPTTGQCMLNGKVQGGGPGDVLYWNNTGGPLPPNLAAKKPSIIPANMPQAPCAFACHHTSPNNQDYYTLATNPKNNIQLRYSVLHSAASNVIGGLQTNQAAQNLLTLGVYEFNAPGTTGPNDPGVTKVYPTDNLEAANDWAAASSDTHDIQPPLMVQNGPNTNFENALSYLNTNLKRPGSGQNAGSPKKDLIIVTDGLDDYPSAACGNDRCEGPFNPAACQTLKNEGYTIYILYTPYYPVPNPYYLSNDLAFTQEPANGTPSPIEVAMQQCATQPANPNNNPYYSTANSQTDIENALTIIFKNILGSPGQLSG